MLLILLMYMYEKMYLRLQCRCELKFAPPPLQSPLTTQSLPRVIRHLTFTMVWKKNRIIPIPENRWWNIMQAIVLIKKHTVNNFKK